MTPRSEGPLALALAAVFSRRRVSRNRTSYGGVDRGRSTLYPRHDPGVNVTLQPSPDFRAIFESVPDLYLVLTPELTIVAVSNAYADATMTQREALLGKHIFEAFPDNPDDPLSIDGIRHLRASLNRVKQSLITDTMPVQKYDVRRPESEGGAFEERYWSPVNHPVLEERGQLRYIIHRVEDVTEFIRLKQRGVIELAATDLVRSEAERMESEVFLRSQEAAIASRQLKEATTRLARLYDRAREVDLLKSPSTAIIEIADGGPGVPVEQREAIFERSRKLEGDSGLRFGGTGLGVSIARDYVELHGGTITVRDAAEGRASFVSALPLRAPEGTPVRSAREQDTTTVSECVLEELRKPPDRPLTISRAAADRPLVLVFTDDPDCLRLFSNTLEGRCRVDATSVIGSGVASALALQPDLVVVDLTTPETGAGEIVRALRARREFDSTSIVALTANSDLDARLRILKEGANDYLLKPFSADELRTRVGTLMEMKQAAQRNRQLSMELGASNESVKDLSRQLMEAMRELDGLSYAVSHDFRAPLRAIHGFSAILSSEYGSSLALEARAYLERISAGAKRMSELIDGLVELSRCGRVPLERERVDLARLGRAVVEELRTRDASRDVHVTVTGPLWAHADLHLARLAVANLIGNAWKFTSQTTGASITMGAEESEEGSVFFVRDNGVGFEQRYAGRLFVPFQRLHGSEFAGTGIGLAVVRKIALRHGGRVWAKGVSGGGATFRFTLSDDSAKA